MLLKLQVTFQQSLLKFSSYYLGTYIYIYRDNMYQLLISTFIVNMYNNIAAVNSST